MTADGYFYVGEKKIGYYIENSNVQVTTHKHVEWMSRGIYFMDDKGNSIGYRAIYHPADELTVFPETAKKWYEEYISGNMH